MRKLLIIILIGAPILCKAQYNSIAGKNRAYTEKREYVEVTDEDGEVLKDNRGEAIVEEVIVLEEVEADQFGNPEGDEYDLAKDNAFSGNTIAVLNIIGTNLNYLKPEVQSKGFNLHEWRHEVPSPAQLKQDLSQVSQLWVISGGTQMLTDAHADVIEEFFNSGKGLYIWGDNRPLYADANFLTRRLFNTIMEGNTHASTVVGISGEGKGRSGIVDGHLISTGVANMYEGTSIATVKATQELSPLIYDSTDQLVAAVYEKNGKRAIIDGGFTRLWYDWESSAGTARYLKNAAAWLANYERFGDELLSQD